MIKVIWLLLFFLLFASPVYAENKNRQRENSSANTILEIGKKHFPTVRFDAKTIVAADINCDNEADFAILGYDENNAYIMVILGKLSVNSKQSTMTMGLSGNAHSYLCGSKANLSLESLNKPLEDEVGALEGYKESTSCKGLNVSDDLCDSFHFYWNHSADELGVWRL